MTDTATPTIPFVTRIGLIGDVHGHVAALKTALGFLEGMPGIDAVLCTGDTTGRHGDGDTTSACRLLRDKGVLTILGNHDRWSIENESDRILIGLSDEWPLPEDVVAFLKSLPSTREFATPRGPMLLCHGTGDDDLTGVYPGDIGLSLEANHKLHALYSEGHFRYMVAGHTHQRMVRSFDHLTVINAAALADESDAVLPMRVSPGTVLRRKNPCFSVLDFEAGCVQFYNIAPDSLVIAKAECFPI